MQISQLRAFCAVAQTGSITTAARVLNKVPSSITVRIRQLEEDLGRELFLRENKRMSLSPAGRQLLDHAQQILDLTDGTRALMRDEETSGPLLVGALDVVLVDYMPHLIGMMRQRHRGINLTVRHQASEDLVAHVADGSLDIALTEGPISSKALRSKVAFVDEMLLVTELSHRDVHQPADLECGELYGFRHDCSFRFRMDRWLSAGDRLDMPVIEIESYHTMLACVSAGMGAAWMLRSILKTLPGHHQVKAHSLGEHGRTEIHFVWRDGHLSRNAKLLMESAMTV
ncbi:DNA-binding transcriptional regulator, LysR family [Sphingobium sp. AP50]|uniref:LysR family transcriptional regulator n=1 Tax=Sphingobium sp. AP50 TaxID=1884369 RepID=UPI0008AE2083|nr:LysR family transcriptional regulator [Sphingobium sp. AP50]SEJ90427.1 DNA-binding transcriptional regulator, LysR family [Sphingobium sp. AP50]